MSDGSRPDRAGAVCASAQSLSRQTQEEEPVTEHDVLVGFRLRLFTLADELGNISQA